MVLMQIISINAYLTLEHFKKYCRDFEHAQLKGGDKDPYRVGLKLKDGGWVYVQGLRTMKLMRITNFNCRF